MADVHQQSNATQWWREDEAAVSKMLDTNVAQGLTSREAADRLATYGSNRLQESAKEPKWRTFLRQFQDPLIYMLLAATAISIIAWLMEGAHGVPYEAIVIIVIVLLNAVLGFTQEARAEAAVEALQKMVAADSSVIRDGQERRVSAADLVPGDVMVLAEGDAISADGRLVHTSTLTVAEAALTGESEPALPRMAPCLTSTWTAGFTALWPTAQWCRSNRRGTPPCA